MNLEQSMRIAISFAREAAKSRRRGLCTACVDVLAVTGAGITLMGGDQAGPLCVSSAAIGELEDAQFMNGAGPCPDAFRLGRPVHAFDFDGDEANRWPSFVHVALAAGIHAAFAFPLSQAGATVGVLSLYQHARGDLSHAQHEDSAAMVEILTETVLSLQDAAPRGVLADGLEGAAEYRAELHQASGMVASQLRIPVAEALVRIRAHAFAVERPLRDIAGDIVGRRLRLTDDRNDTGERS